MFSLSLMPNSRNLIADIKDKEKGIHANHYKTITPQRKTARKTESKELQNKPPDRQKRGAVGLYLEIISLNVNR